MGIKQRIEKLEKRAGLGAEDDFTDREKHPAIAYICKREDGEAGAEAAQKEAVAKWEAENGPLNGREPFFVERCLVSPTGPQKAETLPVFLR